MKLQQSDIKKSQQWIRSISKGINSKCRRCQIATDPTRLKILKLLDKHGKLCVSDVASILNVTLSAISHQFSLLERVGLVKKEKIGKMVGYELDVNHSQLECLLDENA